MKKYIVSLCFALFAFVLFAQEESPHLKFKGVPIDGSLNEYVQKMKLAGFTYLGVEDGIALLKGDFAGYKNCTVGVSTLKQKDLVSKIVVIFSDYETWAPLSNNYYSLKEMLSEKYGKATDVIEKFQGYSEPRDDQSRMVKVWSDQCTFITTFETPKGEIQLSIVHSKSLSGTVILSYIDKINGDIIRKKDIDDL